MKRILAFIVAGCLAAIASAAEPYPTKPVKILVPYAAGGGTDVLARMVAQQMGKSTGGTFVIENRPGAAGTIASQAVAKAPPDGYTLMVVDTSFSMVPAVRKSLPYDTAKDFTPIAQIASLPVVLLVSPSLGVKNMQEFMAMIRSRKLFYASAGAGTVFHLLTEQFHHAANVKADHVAFRGGSESLNALIGGQVHFTLGSVATSLPFIKSGKLIGLAVITDGGRSPALPDVPTMNELGLKGLSMSQWFGLLGPAGMDAEVVSRLQAAVKAAVAKAEIRDPLRPVGWELVGGTSAELANLIASDLSRWSAVVKAANIQQQE